MSQNMEQSSYELEHNLESVQVKSGAVIDITQAFLLR